MDIEIVNQVNKTIDAIKKEYKNIIIDYHYDLDEDLYLISHNNSELHYNNSEFLNFVGGLLRKYIFNEDIYNVSFVYDYEFDVESRKEHKQYKHLDRTDNLGICNYNTIKKTISYKAELSLDKAKGENHILSKIQYDKKYESNDKKNQYNVNEILKSEYFSEFSLFGNKEQDDDAA